MVQTPSMKILWFHTIDDSLRTDQSSIQNRVRFKRSFDDMTPEQTIVLITGPVSTCSNTIAFLEPNLGS